MKFVFKKDAKSALVSSKNPSECGLGTRGGGGGNLRE